MRSDKNKADQNSAWQASLQALDEDLQRLEASLRTYAASAHPQRYEAVRGYLPCLEGHRRTLAAGPRQEN